MWKVKNFNKQTSKSQKNNTVNKFVKNDVAKNNFDDIFFDRSLSVITFFARLVFRIKKNQHAYFLFDRFEHLRRRQNCDEFILIHFDIAIKNDANFDRAKNTFMKFVLRIYKISFFRRDAEFVESENHESFTTNHVRQTL